MNFSWAIDLDPKGANNQIKEAINKRYLPDDDDTTMGLDTADTMDQSVGVNELSDEDEDQIVNEPKRAAFELWVEIQGLYLILNIRKMIFK